MDWQFCPCRVEEECQRFCAAENHLCFTAVGAPQYEAQQLVQIIKNEFLSNHVAHRNTKYMCRINTDGIEQSLTISSYHLYCVGYIRLAAPPVPLLLAVAPIALALIIDVDITAFCERHLSSLVFRLYKHLHYPQYYIRQVLQVGSICGC